MTSGTVLNRPGLSKGTAMTRIRIRRLPTATFNTHFRFVVMDRFTRRAA